MDTRVNSVAGGDVEGQLVQFSIDVQAVAVCARVGVECEAIGAGLNHISSRSLQQRPELVVAVEEELDGGDAGAAHCSVTGWVARMRSEERRVGKECRSRWSPYH